MVQPTVQEARDRRNERLGPGFPGHEGSDQMIALCGIINIAVPLCSRRERRSCRTDIRIIPAGYKVDTLECVPSGLIGR
jgi:hypothetical protein